MTGVQRNNVARNAGIKIINTLESVDRFWNGLDLTKHITESAMSDTDIKKNINEGVESLGVMSDAQKSLSMLSKSFQ